MKIACLLISLALPHALHAQPADPSKTSPLIQARETFIGLSVLDLDASTQWYSDKLGLEVTRQFARTDETRSRAALLQGGGVTVELVQHDDAVPLRTILPRPGGALYVHGIFKVGMTIDNFDDIASACMSLMTAATDKVAEWVASGEIAAECAEDKAAHAG